MTPVEPQYYDYNRHKLMFDSDDDMVTWEDKLEGVDLPLVVDLSHWIGCITRSTLPYDMFLDKISDGIILCNFGNTINAMTGFGAQRQISSIMYPDADEHDESYCRHNIASFLQWCKTYGLNREWLFTVSDLADKQNGRKILQALLWIGRLAHRRGVPAPQIVKIEEKYEMRYYTFMCRIISEPPLPFSALFKEEEEQGKEKKGSRISVTSFFGRRSSNRGSINSNLSLTSRSSTGTLPPLVEDRKKSLIGLTKKQKKKRQAMAALEEPEFISPSSDLQHIYIQIMTLMYHKGFQRAKPKSCISSAMEDWQSDLHLTDPSSLPRDDFGVAPSRGWTMSSKSPSPFNLNQTMTPTSDFHPNAFSGVGDQATYDPLAGGKAAFRINGLQQELDSSSDGAFADDDKVTVNSILQTSMREDAAYMQEANAKLRSLLDEAADKEVQSITSSQDIRDRNRLIDEDEASVSIHNNPKIDFDDVDSDISGIRRKDRNQKKHLKNPDPLESAKQEQSIKNSDKVTEMPKSPRTGTPKAKAAKYGSVDREESSYDREGYTGSPGLTFGQVLLIVICPCRLCFGARR